MEDANKLCYKGIRDRYMKRKCQKSFIKEIL